MLVSGRSPYSLIWNTGNSFESSLCFLLQFHLLPSLLVVHNWSCLLAFTHIAPNTWNVPFTPSVSTSFPWLICPGPLRITHLRITSSGSHLSPNTPPAPPPWGSLLFVFMGSYGYSTIAMTTFLGGKFTVYLIVFPH